VRAFACSNCGAFVVFEADVCLRCGRRLGFDAGTRELVALDGDGPLHVVRAGAAEDAVAGHPCANARVAACNWLAAGDGALCPSCAYTRTRPNDGDEAGLAAFAVAEAAKRRLLFELLDLGIPSPSYRDRDGGLAFDLLSSADGPVTTGHANGVVTLDLAETDDPHRELVRQQMGEPYRTLLGHLRHEVGHWLFGVLAPDEARRERARERFGDERADYQAALDRHYADGPPDDWPDAFVSAYATMHPAEDWAETVAHYLHIRDTLQTAASHRVQVLGPDVPTEDPGGLIAIPDLAGPGFDELLATWLPLTYALNALNRSMGLGDLYPFVLAPPAVAKLALVHELVGEAAG
jgi:hypothetical protein